MIVVIGCPVGRRDSGRIVADGLVARIAVQTAAAGRAVQLIGRIGDDAIADAVLQDLARAGVGHVAILRDPARATPVGRPFADGFERPEVDAADVELALRYLTDFDVIVLVEAAGAGVIDVVVRATEWGEAALVVVGERWTELPSQAHGILAEPGESEMAVAARVAILAASLDTAASPDAAPGV